MASIKSFITYLVFGWLFLTGALAAIVYEGGTVIAYDNSTENMKILYNASIVIEGNEITQILATNDSASFPTNANRIDASGKIISPGFIDVHHHLWQTAFRGLASNTTLIQYFQRYSEFSPAIQYFTPSDVHLGQLMGIFEMQYQGTTTVLDHAHSTWSDDFADAAVDATFESGIRSYFAYAVHPLSNGYTWSDQLAKIRSLASEDRFKGEDGLVRLGLAFDYFFAAPQANISELSTLVQDSNLSICTTHYVGGAWNAANSPQLLDSLGLLNTSLPVVFSHATSLTYQDASLLRGTDQHICTTPESEFHFGHVNPNAHNIQDQASLGVDCHFTYSASMVQQARLWLQSLRWPAYLEPEEHWELPLNNPMSVNQAFHLITRGGALALRRPDLGAIEVGGKADLVVFRTDSPNMVAASDPVAAIILHSDTGDVEDVLVDGKFVKRNGQITHPAYQQTSKDFAASAKRIQDVWAKIEWPPLDTFFPLGPAEYTMAPVIDTQRGAGTGY